MAGRFCGHTDSPLSERGVAQLPPLVERFSATKFAAMYSSDLLRCRQTAQPLADFHHLAPQFCASLRELNFGRWDGWSWAEIEADDAEFAREWIEKYPLLAAPEGEDFLSFQTRIRTTLHEIAATHVGAHVLVVCHGGLLRMAAMLAGKHPIAEFGKLHFGYTESLTLEISKNDWQIATI